VAVLHTIGLGLWLAAITIHWQGDAVEVRGVPAASGFTAVQIAERLSVTVDGQQTPLAGSFSTAGDEVRFRPRFPLQPGLRYRATWNQPGASPVSETFSIAKKEVAPSARVERIFPTSAVLPSNQLKLYIHFSAPMSRGEAWQRIHLVDDQGKEVPQPFLEIEQELWDREQKRLTVLFDPGRIKRGLVPHNEVGPALIEGRNYEIVIDREWPDAKGDPMVERCVKTFRVGDADRTPPTLSNWKLTAPQSAAAALILDFPEPMDAALLQRLLWVEDGHGKRLDGVVTLAQDEKRWVFTPSSKWASGSYNVKIGAILEDLAGNRIDRKFDVDTFERIEMRLTVTMRTIPFSVTVSPETK
jgi:hypothetical protein